MKYKIISVESRKGGVGKTTAALNLSALLVERGYKTLLLDVDITGTSIEGSYNSAFWKGKINSIKQNKKDINLLKIFHDVFLQGKGLPKFSFENGSSNKVDIFNSESKNDFIISANKINIFNSEIYNDDLSLICDPRILFDELHSFWLIDMIESLCDSFAACMNDEKTVIVLDNSPGYVGLGKAIHDWLTDIGPDCGKFLTISSLDVQDLNSCLNAIQAIENIVDKKFEGAKYYRQLKDLESSIEEPSKESKKFFLKLATNEAKNGRYQYFKTENLNRPELPSYQSLIINKAPREIKSDTLHYDVYKSLKGDDKKREVFQTFSGEQRDRKPQNVVYFDNYIHFQFVEPFIEKVRYDRNREYSSLKRYFTRIEKEIEENQHREIENSYSKFLNTIDNYENTLSKLLGRLMETGYDNIVRLVEERWHPRTPLIKTQQIFENLCEDTPFLERYSKIENDRYDNDIDEKYFRNEMEELFMNIEHFVREEWSLSYERRKNQFSLETLCFFLVEPFIKREYPEREDSFFRSILVLILFIQNERLKRSGDLIRNKKNGSFQFFLANENITSTEIIKYRHLMKVLPFKYFEKIHFNEKIFYFFEKSGMLPNFYNSFCHTQARLIDMHDDFRFLITILKNVTIDERNERTIIFPNIRDILDDVIINKKTPFSYANEKIHKEFQGAQYMSDFREILVNNVISKWGL
ncbi:hypothetical protein FACS189441_2260 [Betaproteobacteria bacterium]|nr:hypothetical protein FACS189441_2260 [Betaproteobacteria bacterium]